jgi:hypothetical protein
MGSKNSKDNLTDENLRISELSVLRLSGLPDDQIE